MKILSFFNNKGGVGKTTLACNYAHYAHKVEKKKVLVLDMDPQSNATQLLLTQESWSKIYKLDTMNSDSTIMRPLKRIQKGHSDITENPYVVQSDEFGIDLIPGHPALSLVEDSLSKAWGEIYTKPAALEATNWMNVLLQDESLYSYDLVVIDVGPSLGALNRSVLLSSTHYVTPVEADLFSLYALQNIGQWMDGWINNYSTAINIQKENNLDPIEDFILQELKIKTGYIGYTTKQYIARRENGKVRKTQSYEKYMHLLPERAKELTKNSSIKDKFPNMDIGIVPNMFSMIPRAQEAHKPIAELTTDDGLIGGQPKQLKLYTEELDKVFKAISDRMEA